ncbi:MAG TPA: glucosyl-3-phosphoglycerate synthase [Actinomycetota bacterium]|nr:glucosyl-3-phosphoglycerate synthase [Actinomycetota bacterium]
MATSRDPWDWFAARTLHHDSYADAAALARAKEDAGRTVSVCLPTRDEADTVGAIVRTIREELMEAVPLVDEIAVIDSASTDRTAAVAAEAGAVVHQDAEILPQLDVYGGKGDALWKSLFVLKGDLICFIDADIREFDARFVRGLLGPLLREEGVRFTKGFYERPIHQGGELAPTGGGRVTELMARPLVNLFLPELAPVIQPLSGEYAGTRELLESVPFLSGYGVDLGLLIDITQQHGLDVIAQVDLDQRIHRNHPLQSVGRMAFGVLQAAVTKLREQGRLSVHEPLVSLLHQFVPEEHGYRAETADIPILERPPAASLPEYRPGRRHAGPAAGSDPAAG